MTDERTNGGDVNDGDVIVEYTPRQRIARQAAKAQTAAWEVLSGAQDDDPGELAELGQSIAKAGQRIQRLSGRIEEETEPGGGEPGEGETDPPSEPLTEEEKAWIRSLPEGYQEHYRERLEAGGDPRRMYEWLREHFEGREPGDPPVDPPTEPTDPPVTPPPVEVGETLRTYLITPTELVMPDGSRLGMKDGRNSMSESFDRSLADDTTPPDLIRFRGGFGGMQVAMDRPGTRVASSREKPLNVIVQGEGRGSMDSRIFSMITGEQYKGGNVNRENPAIYRLEFVDFTLDLRSAGKYPFLTGMKTRINLFAVKRCTILTVGGVGSSVYSAIRGNAAACYVIEDVDNLGGANEYGIAYLDYGPGKSRIRRVKGKNGGRGLIQGVMRDMNGSFVKPWISSDDELDIEDVESIDNGGKDGSSAVSINGWGGGRIGVRQLYVDTHWNAAALTVAFDSKQAEVTGSPGSWQMVDQGLILPDGYAHNEIDVDLRGCRIRNGDDNPGQAHKSFRHTVLIDSARKVRLRSDALATVGPMGRLELEGNGNGEHRFGTRAIKEFTAEGDFSGWTGTRRNRQPITLP